MEPTRPTDGASLRNIQASRGSDAAQVKETTDEALAERAGDDIADSVELSAEALDVGRAEVARLDGARLESIRQAIAAGDYDVDAGALADRLLDDAFGD